VCRGWRPGWENISFSGIQPCAALSREQLEPAVLSECTARLWGRLGAAVMLWGRWVPILVLWTRLGAHLAVWTRLRAWVSRCSSEAVVHPTRSWCSFSLALQLQSNSVEDTEVQSCHLLQTELSSC